MRRLDLLVMVHIIHHVQAQHCYHPLAHVFSSKKNQSETKTNLEKINNVLFLIEGGIFGNVNICKQKRRPRENHTRTVDNAVRVGVPRTSSEKSDFSSTG